MDHVNDFKWQTDKPAKQESRRNCCVAVGCLVCLAFFALTSRPAPMKNKAREAGTKQNLHAIQLALERYGVDHNGTYPIDLAALIVKNYMPELPGNAFFNGRNPGTGKKLPVDEEPFFRDMRHVRFGDPLYEGNFTYLPWNITVNGKAAGYYLVAYGSHNTKGQDVDGDGMPDHVILVLNSSPQEYAAQRSASPATTQRVEPPEIKELLRR
jgi:hypothetical protein